MKKRSPAHRETPEPVPHAKLIVPKAFGPCILEAQIGHRYSYDDNRLYEIGLHIFPVAGVLHRSRELQSTTFLLLWSPASPRPARRITVLREAAKS